MAPATVHIKDNMIVLSNTAVKALLDGAERCARGYLIGYTNGTLSIQSCPFNTAGGRQLGGGRAIAAKKIIETLGLPKRTGRCPIRMMGTTLLADIVPVGRPRKEDGK